MTDGGSATSRDPLGIVARKDCLHVVLFEPEIPPNTGNIGRLCWSTNSALHLIRPLGFEIDDRAVRRAGLDYWNELDLAVWDTFEALRTAVADVRGRKMEDLMHLFTTKATRSHWSAKFVLGDFLVFGPESRGLPESLLDTATERSVKIPMSNGRSLNLATSAGIGLYEGLRQCLEE